MTLSIAAGSEITAAYLASITAVGVVKPTDQSVTSSTVLVNDNALVIPVVANANYKFDLYLDFEGGTSGSSDIKFTWTVPASTTMRYGIFGAAPGGGLSANT